MTKYLRERLATIEKQKNVEMKKWWDRVLPKKGSLLRQLIVVEINKTSSARKKTL